MKVDRRPMTILEVLVAIALTSILLMALMSYYHHIEILSSKAADARSELFERSYARYRMNQALSPTVRSSSQDFVFYTDEGSSLVFVYDRGADPNPSFANQSLARLYVDDEGNLSLVVWPLPIAKSIEEIPPMQKELLLKGVESLSFEFYHPPDIDRGPVGEERPVNAGDEKPIPPTGWSAHWNRDYKTLPTVARVIVEKGGKKSVYAFSLTNADRYLIQYRR